MVSRRKTLLGLGGLIAGGGTLLGTGAFTSIEAQRSVSLQTADDSDALLSLEVIDDRYVSETEGTIEFELMREAKTRFENLVEVRNRGTQPVQSLRFEFDVVGAQQPNPEVEEALKIISDDATIDAIDEANLLKESDAGDAENNELVPGEAIPFGIEIDLTGGNIDSIDGNPDITLTIIADTEGESESENGSEDGSASIDSVSLDAANGNWIDVTVSVSTDESGAQLRIESLWPEDQPGQEGSIRDETIVSASNGTYSVLGANQVDRVRVSLVSDDGLVLDSITANWNQ